MAMAAYAAAITFLALESYEKNVANKFEKTPQICGQKSWDSTTIYTKHRHGRTVTLWYAHPNPWGAILGRLYAAFA